MACTATSTRPDYREHEIAGQETLLIFQGAIDPGRIRNLPVGLRPLSTVHECPWFPHCYLYFAAGDDTLGSC